MSLPRSVDSIGREDAHVDTSRLRQMSNIFANTVCLDDEYHSEEFLHTTYDDAKAGDSSWRLKEKMRTVGVAVVVCLNIGIDPPDVVKPNPCARKQCWYDPNGQKQKGLEYIGNALQGQYEKWQSKAKFKQCLDPTSEELRKVCLNLRKTARSDRLLLHYNGHGVPKPTKNGELWVFGKHYTHYTPVAICELRQWLGDPAIYVLDCSAAGLLLPHLVDNMPTRENDVTGYDPASLATSYQQNASTLSFVSQSTDNTAIVFAACKGNEQLPFHPSYPADIFTACLTTPTTIAIRWFILQNPNSMHSVDPDIAESIPGKDNDRKTPRGELNWILTAITDTIAWNTLPSKLFQKMFRKDLLVASLFRNFLLAKRIMKSFGCTPQSWPPIPDSTTHSLWQSWDMALESFLTQYVSNSKGSSMTDPLNNMSFNMPNNLTFFNDQLSAFEMWLDYGTTVMATPPQLPVVLQVLLSQSHRMRALQLLKRFLALGSEAIKLSLILGIFPYILKLLQNPADDIKQTLIGIWATVMGFDPSCRQELVKEKSQICFVQCISSTSVSIEHRCLAAFVLAEVCNGFKEGQLSCLQLGLHRACTSVIGQPDHGGDSSVLKLWASLCLYKLCEDFMWAKYLCITEAGHTQLYTQLIDPDPTVRAAAVLALGELFGASTLVSMANLTGAATPGNMHSMRQSSISSAGSSDDGQYTTSSLVDEKDLKEAELQLALQILECCTDGSVMVRVEAIYALSKFFVQPTHIDCIKLVAKLMYMRNTEKKATKPERRSASPLVGEPVTGKSSSSSSVYPWHLSPLESKEITSQVEAFMRARTDDSTDRSSLDTLSLRGSSLLNESQILEPSPQEIPQYQSTNPDIITLMASAYLRLWLALTEVQGKDSHSIVAQAAATIRFRIHCLVAIDEHKGFSSSRIRSASNLSQQLSLSTSPVLPFPPAGIMPGGAAANNLLPPQLRRQWSDQSAEGSSEIPPSLAPPMSPMGLGLLGSPGRAKSVKFGARNSNVQQTLLSSSLTNSAARMSSNSSKMNQTLLQPEGQKPATVVVGSFDSTSTLSASTHPHSVLASSLPNSNQSQGKGQSVSPSVPGAKSTISEAFKDYLQLNEEDLMLSFSSTHYDMVKCQFMQPYLGYEPSEDPLSAEAKIVAYRVNRLKEIIQNDKIIHEMFRDVEEKPSDLLAGLTMGGQGKSFSKSMLDESKSPSMAASSVPNNLCKFEQKNSLYMDSPMSSSLVMFHALQDILVVASESTASIWSLTTNSKIMEVRNKHVLRPGFTGDGITPSVHGSMSASAGTPGRHSKSPTVITLAADQSLFSAHTTNSRITAMTWINESYDSLLMLGSDDGVVKVWRDVSCSDFAGNGSDYVSNATSFGGVSPALPNTVPSTVELATAFAALPDITDTSRGSGLVLSWQQGMGSLVAGGNSNSIRLWDLGREQNVRAFQTGVDTCLTAIASTSVSSSNAFNSHNHYSVGDVGSSSQVNPVSWIFAGFADGSVGVYDERVQSNGGRVHVSPTGIGWLNHAHLRIDVPEVVLGSVRGMVKFWDLRTLRAYKTLEVQKSPLTSLTVHNCAPIMASGSHAQFIKILTLGGEQLGNIIKYYDGFLGQRIGPVSCLAFHPHKLLLASSATDGILSLYGVGGEK